MDPNFYSKNLLLLGKTYLKLHNRKLAAFWLGKARDYPAHTEEDRQVGAAASGCAGSGLRACGGRGPSPGQPAL